MQLIFVFVAIIGYSNAECFDYPDTTCQNITNCDTLRSVFKRQKSFEDRERLRKRHCGFVKDIPKICCPNSNPTSACLTPDGVKGECVDITNCTYFVTMLRNNPVQQDINFIYRSRCDEYSSTKVCCPPTPPIQPIDAFTKECRATALPSDLQNGCCGRSDSYDKITGGRNAKIDEFPWLALLEYINITSYAIETDCGGALISGKYVLTAAHCVDDREDHKLISVLLGEYDTSNNGPDCAAVAGGGIDCNYGAVSIPIESATQHPDYKNWLKGSWHDIAILRLSRMTSFNYFIKPICLPSSDINTMELADVYLSVTGWGSIDKYYSETSIKQVVKVPYVNLTSCKELYSRKRKALWAGQLCAGGESGRDSCRGDSGGPLMRVINERYHLVGLVSFAIRPCGRYPDVYTNMFVYLEWIRANMHE